MREGQEKTEKNIQRDMSVCKMKAKTLAMGERRKGRKESRKGRIREKGVNGIRKGREGEAACTS